MTRLQLWTILLCLLSLQYASSESCGNVDCYDVLRVTQRASFAEIKESYKKLSKLYHPDKSPGVSDDKFKIIARAYEVVSTPLLISNFIAVKILSDERRRSRYDYAIQNPDNWSDEDGFHYNAGPESLDYRMISVCLVICCLFFAVSAKWVISQDFWNPPKVNTKKKKNGKKL